MRDLAVTTPNLKIHLSDRKQFLSTDFFYEKGLVTYLDELDYSRRLLHPEPIYLSCQSKDIYVEIALRFSASSHIIINGYVNSEITLSGTHMTGVLIGVEKVLMEYAKKNDLLDENGDLLFKHICEG